MEFCRYFHGASALTRFSASELAALPLLTSVLPVGVSPFILSLPVVVDLLVHKTVLKNTWKIGKIDWNFRLNADWFLPPTIAAFASANVPAYGTTAAVSPMTQRSSSSIWSCSEFSAGLRVQCGHWVNYNRRHYYGGCHQPRWWICRDAITIAHNGWIIVRWIPAAVHPISVAISIASYWICHSCCLIRP